MVNEGHEIGNHTFTHPNLGEIPGLAYRPRTQCDAAFDRIGDRTLDRPFRPPYFGDAEADKPQEVEPAYRAQKLGYIMVGLRIDPDDWKLPVTADEIVQSHSRTRAWTTIRKRAARWCCCTIPAAIARQRSRRCRN